MVAFFFPMSFKMQAACRYIDIHHAAKHVADWLAWHYNDETGRCNPSIAALSAETRMCPRSVTEAIASLEKAGHITVIRAANTPNEYRLHPIPCAPVYVPKPKRVVRQVQYRARCSTAPNALGGAPNALGVVRQVQGGGAPSADGTVIEQEEKTIIEPSLASATPIASAEADAGNTDSLFPTKSPQPKPKREPKPKPETTADPRLQPIKNGLAPVFEKIKGREFDCDWKKTVGAIRKFLESRSKVTPDEFLEVWSLVCKYSSSPFYPKITDALDVAYLCRNYEAVTGHIERAYHSESQTKR